MLKLTSTLGLAIAAGTGSAQVQLGTERVEPHSEIRSFYVSMSGERIEIDGPDQAFGDRSVGRVWINNRIDPCGLSDPRGPDQLPGTEDDIPELVVWNHALNVADPQNYRTPGLLMAHWADVPANTRVNALGVWAWHDLEARVEGDIIPGFDMIFGFQDRFAGDVPAPEGAASVVNVRIPDLPGVPEDMLPGAHAGFYFAVDLFDPDPAFDETFELGDDDGVGPDSGNFNPFGFYDEPFIGSTKTDGLGPTSLGPGDFGLHDFGYYSTFEFPPNGYEGASTAYLGAFGDVVYAPSAGGGFSFFETQVNPIPTGFQIWRLAPNTAAVFASGIDPVSGLPLGMLDRAKGDFLGYFNGGTISCDFPDPRPPRTQWLEMFFVDPVEICAADFDGDGQVNILDVIAFIQAWSGGLDYDGSGGVNIFDVLLFINDWDTAAGC